MGKQNIILRVASENKEVRDADIDFILNHCSHSVVSFCSGGQDNSIDTKGSNIIMTY